MSSHQQAFSGWVIPSYAPPSPSSGGVIFNVVPIGAIDSSNTLFTMPVIFSDVTVYLNGVKLIRGADFSPLSAPSGTGYDRVRLTVAPDGGAVPDVLTADLVAA